MTTTTRFVDADGSLVLPGEYEIVSTRVIVQAVTRPNGLTVDSQDAVIEHTVKGTRPLGECVACREGGINTPAKVMADGPGGKYPSCGGHPW